MEPKICQNDQMIKWVITNQRHEIWHYDISLISVKGAALGDEGEDCVR